MALAFGPIRNPELKRHSFPWGPICAVVNPQHPIAHLKKVSIEELNKHPPDFAQRNIWLAAPHERHVPKQKLPVHPSIPL